MERKPANKPSGLPAPITMMIVEDDSSVRDILSGWIQDAEGFDCLGVFGDVESAMPVITKRKPNVVLIDINLPGLSGIECVRRVKPTTPETQFVMLTVYEDSNHIFDALSSGATGYLVKTTSREDLISALREVNGGASPMSGNIARKVVQLLQKPNTTLESANQLSKREQEVLTLLAQGYLYKEIADTMGIGYQTVNTYIRRIYEKLHVHSRAQAVALAHNMSRGSGPVSST
ncbi:MAG TPA: response regulator transcription factor [Opitutaceae bacterium]